MKQKLNLTPTNVETLSSGSLSDPRTPGLYIEVQSGHGRISHIWKYRRQLPGKISFHKATLGSYPAHSIADAREWAATINTNVERGINPTEVRQAELAHISQSQTPTLPSQPRSRFLSHDELDLFL